jgi:hypothetical protein
VFFYEYINPEISVKALLGRWFYRAFTFGFRGNEIKFRMMEGMCDDIIGRSENWICKFRFPRDEAWDRDPKRGSENRVFNELQNSASRNGRIDWRIAGAFWVV